MNNKFIFRKRYRIRDFILSCVEFTLIRKGF